MLLSERRRVERNNSHIDPLVYIEGHSPAHLQVYIYIFTDLVIIHFLDESSHSNPKRCCSYSTY